MREYLPYLIILIPISFVLGGIYLAMSGVEGWGWLIFCAFATSSITIKTSKGKKKKNS